MIYRYGLDTEPELLSPVSNAIFLPRHKSGCAEKKRDMEQGFRTKLAETKTSATATNLLFSETLDYVSVNTPWEDAPGVKQPLMPEQILFFFDNIEVERREVSYTSSMLSFRAVIFWL